MGVGVHGNADAGEDIAEAQVRLSSDGNVVLHCNVTECGMGQRSSLCKMVAEVLNVPVERVSLSDPDTMINPFNFGLVGSRGTHAVGYAAIAAAEDAKSKLLEFAARQLKAPKWALETQDGMVYFKSSPGVKMVLMKLLPDFISRLLKSSPGPRIPWIGILGPMRTITGNGNFEADYTKANFIMTFIEVDVDVDTGKTALVRVVQATDVGQIIDPPTLEGQLYGGLGSAGIDTALFEETILDRATGRILNANMIDYKWRVFPELPVFENVILETGISTHRFKAVGVGEIATAPGPSAVLMAISNAIGRRMTKYPATPDRILRELGRI